jgi:hypothetical protein
VHLITQYYNHPNPKRQSEIDLCLIRNLDHPAISHLHNLNENNAIVPKEICKHNKYVESNILNRRMHYKDCLDYAQKSITTQEVCIIINNDIFLGSNHWGSVKEDFFEKTDAPKILNLSRYEYDMKTGKTWTEGNFSSYSSDAWAFQLPLLEIEDTDFPVGTWYRDRAIAERFHRAGYHVYNWASKYKIYHIDRILDREARKPKTDRRGSDESDRGSLLICPYLEYDLFLKFRIKPQKARCKKGCRYKHIGKDRIKKYRNL